MTRPRYKPVPRGYTRVWVLSYCVEGKWRSDGEWFVTHKAAESAGEDYCTPTCPWQEDAWTYRVTPLDVPIGAVPGMGGVK